MSIDYKILHKAMIEKMIPKPISGTLSGHAAGEPFDKLVYLEIKKQFPEHTFRQYEYLNFLFSQNPDATGVEERNNLFESPTVRFLLSRGKNATDEWSLKTPFDEKQNDTADILVVENDFYEIIDIKTRNISKSAQAPNIISAYKLAQLCAKMIDNNEFDNFTLSYFEVDWILEKNNLVCKDTHIAHLFLSNPTELYINWAAAMQIQFHVCDLKQTFKGTQQEWTNEYLKHFVLKAKERAKYMIDKFVTPFEKHTTQQTL
jgi:hypothetical protein